MFEHGLPTTGPCIPAAVETELQIESVMLANRPRLIMRKLNSYLPFLVLAAALSIGRLASAGEKETYPYVCSDGKTYNVWVDPEPLGGLTANGFRLQMRAFCLSSERTIIECIKDETVSTRKCMDEFKSKGNVDQYQGMAVIWVGRIKHSPPESWYQKVLAQNPADLAEKECAEAVVRLDCGRNPQKIESASQLRCLYERSDTSAASAARGCHMFLTKKFESYVNGMPGTPLRMPASMPPKRFTADR